MSRQGVARRLGVALWTLSLALGAAACDGGWTPRAVRPATLASPADRGVRVAVLDRDLDGALEIVRQRAGKVVSVATPPVPLLDVGPTPPLALDATGFSVDVDSFEAGWSTSGVLAVRLGISAEPLPAVVVRPGAPACALRFDLGGASLDIRVRLVRDLAGELDVALADEPLFVSVDAATSDPNTCLTALEDEQAADVQEGATAILSGAIADAVRARYVAEVRSMLATLMLLDAEGIWATADEAQAFALSMGDPAMAGEPVAVQRAQGRTSAAWWSSIALPSRACLTTERPQPIAPSPLPLLPPPAPLDTQGALRRALVLDRAFLRELIHELLDAGTLCEEVASGLETRLPAGALEQVLPGIGAWTDAARYGARVTAGSWGVVGVAADPEGALIRWRDSALRLEVIGEVAGTPLVLLQVTGDAELDWRLEVDAGGPRLALAGARFGNVSVRAPLLDDTAPVLGEPTLSALLEAALQGIGAGDRVLFGSGAWPAAGAPWPDGTVSVATTAVGEQLWLWLDTVPPAR